LNVRNATGLPGDSGTPFGGTVGIDYQTQDGIIFGAAFTSGSQVPQFSTGGHFSLVDEAPSLYVGYVGGPLWGNAVASYDLFQDNIVRLVPLGTFTDQNNANTTGRSLAIALRGGWNLGAGRFITGPVAGLVVQEVRIDGFTEAGLSGVTAMSFGDQTRDNGVSIGSPGRG
jgi:outer membrane lipase/esterase